MSLVLSYRGSQSDVTYINSLTISWDTFFVMMNRQGIHVPPRPVAYTAGNRKHLGSVQDSVQSPSLLSRVNSPVHLSVSDQPGPHVQGSRLHFGSVSDSVKGPSQTVQVHGRGDNPSQVYRTQNQNQIYGIITDNKRQFQADHGPKKSSV